MNRPHAGSGTASAPAPRPSVDRVGCRGRPVLAIPPDRLGPEPTGRGHRGAGASIAPDDPSDSRPGPLPRPDRLRPRAPHGARLQPSANRRRWHRHPGSLGRPRTMAATPSTAPQLRSCPGNTEWVSLGAGRNGGRPVERPSNQRSRQIELYSGATAGCSSGDED